MSESTPQTLDKVVHCLSLLRSMQRELEFIEVSPEDSEYLEGMIGGIVRASTHAEILRNRIELRTLGVAF